MDTLSEYNRQRWNALVKAGIEYSRPFLDLDVNKARQELDPDSIMGDPKGKDVLVLAGGGGQQSAAFGVLGAKVTVFDLSEEQLANDRLAAEHYGYSLRIEQGDMRDLSRFQDDSFDIVYHPYSINFIPDPLPVFSGVRRILRHDGLYRVSFANPFVMSVDDRSWDGRGYHLRQCYQDGEITWDDPNWEVWHEDGSMQKVPGPREFRHTLGKFINGLVNHGFQILGIWEEMSMATDPEPGSWEHFKSFAPPWFMVWTRLEKLLNPHFMGL